jgi:hypothetical protein
LTLAKWIPAFAGMTFLLPSFSRGQESIGFSRPRNGSLLRGEDTPHAVIPRRRESIGFLHGREMDRCFAGRTLPMPSFPLILVTERESIGFLHGREMDRHFRGDDVFRGLDLIRMRRRREMRLR